MSVDIPVFPAHFNTVGGSQVVAVATTGTVGRNFRADCGGCNVMVIDYTTAMACSAWLRVRGRRYRMTPADIAHFEGIAWNVVLTSCNYHASQCRRTSQGR